MAMAIINYGENNTNKKLKKQYPLLFYEYVCIAFFNFVISASGKIQSGVHADISIFSTNFLS